VAETGAQGGAVADSHDRGMRVEIRGLTAEEIGQVLEAVGRVIADRGKDEEGQAYGDKPMWGDHEGIGSAGR